MRPALVIIDMLNEFVRGRLGFGGAEEIIPRIAKLKEWAKERGYPVIYVCDAHRPGDHEFEIWGEHALDGTEGARVVKELEPSPGDAVVKKRVYSGFFGTDLEELLRGAGVNAVILTGVHTHICVAHTAADAFYRGLKVVVVSDATATANREDHERALEAMKKFYGADVMAAKEVVSRL